MPIFEADEPITDAEMQRQQQQLDDKIARLKEAQLMQELEAATEHDVPFGGDCWRDDAMNGDEALEDSSDEVH